MVIPAGRVLTLRLLFTAKPQSAPLCRLHVLHRSSRLNCPLSTSFGGVRFAATKASRAKAGTKTAAKKTTKKPAAKKATAKRTTANRTTAKRTTAKRTTAKRATAKKPAAKKKATTVKRGAAKKKPIKKAVKKPVRKAKKVPLTPQQKKRKELKELRVRALDVPGIPPASGWMAFSLEKKGITPEVSKEWAALSAEEKQKYTEKAAATREAKIKVYEKWVAATPAAKILEANRARARIRKLGVKSKVGRILDPRKPKRPVNAQILHMMDQYKSGRPFENPDGSKMSTVDILKTCNAEYRALPAQEKEKYEERRKAEVEKYHQAKTKVYGTEYA